MNLQEANLLENGCYHCNMHLKIGHGREERHRKESYVVMFLIPKKYSHFALALWKKNNIKMNKCMPYFKKLKKVLLFIPFDFIFSSGTKLLPN